MIKPGDAGRVSLGVFDFSGRRLLVREIPVQKLFEEDLPRPNLSFSRAVVRNKEPNVRVENQVQVAVAADDRTGDRMVETGLFFCTSERNPAKLRAMRCRTLSPVGFERKRLQNCGHFSRFSTRSRRISLQPRLSGGASGNRTVVRTSGTHKSAHVRGLQPIVQQQHTVGEWDKGRRWARLVPFHDLEESEYPAIVRSN